MKNVNLLGGGFRIRSLFLCIFILKLLNLTTMVAQTIYEECGTQDFTNPNFNGTYSNSIETIDNTASEPFILNLYYWQVKAPDGSYGSTALSENDISKVWQP